MHLHPLGLGLVDECEGGIHSVRLEGLLVQDDIVYRLGMEFVEIHLVHEFRPEPDAVGVFGGLLAGHYCCCEEYNCKNLFHTDKLKFKFYISPVECLHSLPCRCAKCRLVVRRVANPPLAINE